MFCETWHKERFGKSPETGEEYLENHAYPLTAADGLYCIADSAGVRSLCGNIVYKLLPFLKTIKRPERLCKRCEAVQTKLNKPA